MAYLHIRELYIGKILHSIDVGDRRVDPFPLDLRNRDLSNLLLNGADLQWANFEGSNLRGTKFKGADLSHANLRNADIRYCDLSEADLREADLTGAEIYPCGYNKRTKLWATKIDPDSELSTMSQAIVTARLKRSTDVDDFDLHQSEKETAALLDPNTKRLERKVARERHGWNSQCESAVLKAKLRVLRYTREIEMNRVRREKDLRFLRKKRVDMDFLSRFLNEEALWD
jgi:hypothetical protein